MSDLTLSGQKSLAMAEMNPVLTDIAAFEGTIDSIDVADDETLGQMGDLIKMMGHRRKKLEAARTRLVKPLNAVVKDINALFKGPRERIDAIVATAKGKCSKYIEAKEIVEKERQRQAEEQAREEREEAQRLAAKLRDKAGETAEDTAQAIEAQADKKLEAASAPVKAAPVRGDQATVSQRKTWAAEVVDLVELARAVADGKLPLEVIEPNMSALRRMAKDTSIERTIHGVKFYQKSSVALF